MADVSKIKTPNGTTYDIKDSSAIHTVDTTLSGTSTNPVQNKAIQAAITEINATLEQIISPEDRKVTDVNTAVDPGTYRFYGTGQTANLPSDITVASPFGLLEVFVCGVYIKQVLTYFISKTPGVPPVVYIRRSVDSGATWGPWGKFVGTEVN